MTNDQDKKGNNYGSALALMSEVTGWIVAPLVISLFTGKWLDQQYHTGPWWFLGLTALAFAITCIGLVRMAQRFIKQTAQEADKQKKDHDQYGRDQQPK